MLTSSDCPNAMHEAAGRKRNGEAILARTFGDTVGSFPTLFAQLLLVHTSGP